MNKRLIGTCFLAAVFTAAFSQRFAGDGPSESGVQMELSPDVLYG